LSEEYVVTLPLPPKLYADLSSLLQRAVEEQQFNLREGAEIIIATPGRLKDVIDRHVLVLSQCTYVVMDEADRMVNLGFEVDLTYILDALPTEFLKGENSMDIDGAVNTKARTRVTTLFSATMPPAVERLAKKYLKKAAVITIGEAGRAVDTVEQRVEFVAGEEKKKYVGFLFHRVPADLEFRQRLVEILNTGGFASPIIVFVNQKKTADMVAKDLQRAHVCHLSSLWSPSKVFFLSVERIHIALWEVTRTARSCPCTAQKRRSRRPRGDRSRRSWYRCSRRIPRHQLPDGQHNRSICSPYWSVQVQYEFILSCLTYFYRSNGSCWQARCCDHLPHK
jgi:DEAD/DEAH box helicase